MKRVVILLLATSGCVSGTRFMTPPEPVTPAPNSVTVDLPRDSAWTMMVPALGRTFFVINTLERSSGLLNVSYSGESGNYLDCGTYTSEVTSEGGETTRYEFPAASAYERFQIATGDGWEDVLVDVTWRVALEGRANVVLEALGADQTRVSVSVRYVVTHSWLPDGGAPDITTAAFSSGQPGSTDDGFLTCYPTGALEQEILSALTDAI